jgi:(2Fe-2S) ferredoxin
VSNVKRYRLSVCKGVDCRANGSDAVFAAASEGVRSCGATERCEVYRGGCYGLCHLGPNVVVRDEVGAPRDPFASEDFQLTYDPGETYYWKMTAEKITRVIQEHIGKGTRLDDLVGDPTLEEDFRKRG